MGAKHANSRSNTSDIGGKLVGNGRVTTFSMLFLFVWRGYSADWEVRGSSTWVQHPAVGMGYRRAKPLLVLGESARKSASERAREYDSSLQQQIDLIE